MNPVKKKNTEKDKDKDAETNQYYTIQSEYVVHAGWKYFVDDQAYT